jgi:trans-aconitate methyltransferase
VGDYNKYYLSEHLFGEPYPELVDFFKARKVGSVLDLGCGQGRDALFLANLGFDVTGVDNSKLGISQMLKEATKLGLKLEGIVADIYEWEMYSTFNYIVLDSMFHFLKKDREKELELVHKICNGIDNGAVVVFCIQDTGKKVSILEEAIAQNQGLVTITNIPFIYTYKDDETGHTSQSNYKLIAVQK